MIKNSLLIFMTLLVSGVMNFGAISLFSRLLTPAEYGTFALASAASALSIAFLFQWVLHSFMRFFPQKEFSQNKVYLANFMAILGVMACGFFGFAALGYGIDRLLGHPLTMIPPLLWILIPAAAFFETVFTAISHYTRLVSAHIKLYAVATIGRSVLYIAAGYALVDAGYGYNGLLIALVLSFFLPAALLLVLERDGRAASRSDIKPSIIRDIIAFGSPIIAVTSLQTALGSTDNFLLSILMGPEATGHYAIALDLVTKSLIFLMIIINRTTYPLLVLKMEREGPDAARTQYHHNTVILMALSIPACAGLALLAKNIVTLLLGAEFQDVAGNLVPYITLVSFMNCAFQFYLTPAFHLAKKTNLMIVPVAMGLLVNIGVSWVAIPHFGLYGSIIGGVCGYGTAVLLSLIFVRSVFPLPFPAIDFAKILLATASMSLCVWPFYEGRSLLNLLLGVSAGGLSYGAAVLLLNIGGYRRLILQKLRR